MEPDGTPKSSHGPLARTSPSADLSSLQSAIQQHQIRFSTLEDKLDVAFASLLSKIDNLSTGQEIEASVSSSRKHIKKCHQVWKAARASLLRSSERMCNSANRRRIPAPVYSPGQQVLLRTKDLHLQSLIKTSRSC
ncbi:uncharacterized protein dbndd1 isoform X2 [Entelurus aequoreus]|uniref:uncharacterized protein dbndd1 isoform X2 n=1 Tax=Entelurus aequoreus TaxID=161455 RepID=UPI002B1CF079|nr:uncharacterized protein dbndd1 isoform X2 [Entelurus aequoreus]